MNMVCVKLKFAGTKGELEKLGYGFVYRDYGKDALNLWYHTDEVGAVGAPPGGKRKIKVALIVNGRLYPEEVTVYVDGENALIDGEKFNSLL